ncbi:uncharacterized protein LOC143285111 isoform X2 [Babylonia areolata]|uniref:uncharacterized protein LOC143285111 isoform X2 n=1 Tax=Babylonia areolata TaxID=304850 RepID=UPI003FD0601D
MVSRMMPWASTTTAGVGVRVFAVFFLLVVGLGTSQGQFDQPDPCVDAITLNDAWRNPEADENPNHCDNITEGWYSFALGKDPAVIPTLCLQDHTCGSRVPLHLDMDGQRTPEVGQNVTAWLCGSYNVLGAVDCCVQRQPVTIKRCDTEVFVYRLRPQRVCPVAVCVVRYGASISPQFVAKHGDVPRSVQPRSAVTRPPAHPTTTHFETSPPAVTTASTTVQEIVKPLVTMAYSTSSSITDSTSILSLSSSSSLPLIDSNDTSSSSSASSSSSSSNSSAVASSSNDSSSGGSHVVGEDSFPIGNQSLTTASSAHQQFANSSEAQSVNDTMQDPGLHHDNQTSTFLPPLDTDNATAASHNASDLKPEGDAATPEMKPSTGSSGPVTTQLPVSSSSSTPADVKTSSTVKMATPDGLATTSSSAGPGPASSLGGGGATYVTPTRGSPASVSPTARDVLSEAVRFVLNGTFQEAQFRDALLLFVNNASIRAELTEGQVGEEGLSNVTLRAQTPLMGRGFQNITVVDVLLADPSTNGTIPAQRFVTIIHNDNFADLLFSRAGQTLIKVCPSADRCDLDVLMRGANDAHKMSLFDRNRGVFIAVIVVAAICLLVLLVGLLVMRYRHRGVWVLAPDQEEKGSDLQAVENPMTDQQILQGESTPVPASTTATATATTSLTINGDHHHNNPPASSFAEDEFKDIPAADEDNGWVVPLDQAPPSASQALAEKTEDTQF